MPSRPPSLSTLMCHSAEGNGGGPSASSKWFIEIPWRADGAHGAVRRESRCRRRWLRAPKRSFRLLQSGLRTQRVRHEGIEGTEPILAISRRSALRHVRRIEALYRSGEARGMGRAAAGVVRVVRVVEEGARGSCRHLARKGPCRASRGLQDRGPHAGLAALQALPEPHDQLLAHVHESRLYEPVRDDRCQV